MPIQPIEQYRNDQNSLLSIMQNGSGVITGIFDRAIQIGRDVSNKRTQQEQNLLGIRGQERALAQRGAQDLQQNIEDAQRFARGAYEFDVKFGERAQDRSFSQERARTNDQFSQMNADRNYGLAQERVGIAQQGVDLRTQEIQAEAEAAQAARAQTQQNVQNFFGGTPEDPNSPQSFLEAVNAPTNGVGPAPVRGRGPTTENTNQSLEVQYQQALKVAGDKNVSASLQKIAAAKAERIRKQLEPEGVAPLTPAEQRARTKAAQDTNLYNLKIQEKESEIADGVAKKAKENITSLIRQNPEAFPYSAPQLTVDPEADETPEQTAKRQATFDANLTPQQIAQQKAAFDQDAVEINAIKRAKNKADYINSLSTAKVRDPKTGKWSNVVLTPEMLKAREELYDMVTGGSTTTAPAAPTTTSPLRFNQ